MATQRERREATTAALRSATLACLVERGHAGTTTAEICRKAGLSQGALFRHYDTKAELLLDVVADLFPRLVGSFIDDDGLELISALTLPERVTAVIEQLWATYERPDLLAALELYVAARTDPELAGALARFEPEHRARIHVVAARLFPEVADHPSFAGTVDVVVDAVQGATLGRHALGVRSGDDAMRAALAETMLRLVG
jgi:AcrR family transcriptional regulator